MKITPGLLLKFFSVAKEAAGIQEQVKSSVDSYPTLITDVEVVRVTLSPPGNNHTPVAVVDILYDVTTDTMYKTVVTKEVKS